MEGFRASAKVWTIPEIQTFDSTCTQSEGTQSKATCTQSLPCPYDELNSNSVLLSCRPAVSLARPHISPLGFSVVLSWRLEIVATKHT